MSQLHCPSCGHLIGTLNVAATAPGPEEKVASWLQTYPRPDSRQVSSGDLFARYQADTEDHVTSHRAFSLAVQAAGLIKRRGTAGVRIFVFPH
jgi:hypothetical protein